MEATNSYQTLILVILDESESMSNLKSDMIIEFNKFLHKQQKLEDEAKFYLVKFNTFITVVYDGIDLKKVKEINEDYDPDGCTALFDAIVQSINMVKEDKTENDRVIVVIMTDGEDNSSKEGKQTEAKKLIEDCGAQKDWTFLYVGVEPEHFTREVGIPNVHGITFDSSCPKKSFDMIDGAVSSLRLGKSSQGEDLFNTDN